MSVPARERLLAERARAARSRLARAANEAFLGRHPEWLARHGERARLHGQTDAAYHLDFLVAALELDQPDAFVAYARWTAGVLTSRGIDPAALAEHLQLLGQALEAEVGPWPAVSRALEAGVSALGEARAPADPDGLPDATATFLQAILSGNRPAAQAITEELLRAGLTLHELYVDVLEAALREVGRRWEQNLISVAREHLATAVVQGVMPQLLPRVMAAHAPPRGRAVVSGVEGERHQVGPAMVADVLTLHGWQVDFLGTDLPVAALVAQVREADASLLALSAATLPAVDGVRRAIEGVAAARLAPRVIVGGRVFRQHPELVAQVGAAGSSPDLRGLPALLARLFPPQDAESP